MINTKSKLIRSTILALAVVMGGCVSASASDDASITKSVSSHHCQHKLV